MVSKKLAIVSLPVAALLSMGNTSCENTSSSRTLKKIVDVQDIDAQTLNLGSAGSFDFKSVANEQIYSVLSKTNSFVFKYKASSSQPSSNNNSNSSGALSKATVELQKVNVNLSPEGSAEFEKWVMEKTGQAPDPRFSTEASCMVMMPQVDLKGSINAFEMVGGGGLQIGYSPAGSTTNVTGQLDFQVEYSQMNLSMHALNPLSNNVIKSVTIDQKQTKTKVNALISLLALFNIGGSYYYTTPLSDVTYKGLTKAVDQLASALKSEEWYTRVLYDLDPELAIIGGKETGLQNGDQLAIYNDVYAWDGEPCNSNYIGGGSTQAAAIVEVVGAGDGLSYVKVVEGTRVADPVVGAKVKVYKLGSNSSSKTAAK